MGVCWVAAATGGFVDSINGELVCGHFYFIKYCAVCGGRVSLRSKPECGFGARQVTPSHGFQ